MPGSSTRSRRRRSHRSSKPATTQERRIDERAQGSPALPNTPARGGGQSEQREDARQTTEAGPAQAAAGLTPVEQAKLTKKKTGLMHRIVRKTEGWTAPGPYTEDMEPQESERDKAMNKAGLATEVLGEIPIVGRVLKMLKSLGDAIVGTIDAVTDSRKAKLSADEKANLTFLWLDKVLEMAGSIKDILEDTDKFAGAVPIIGGVLTCVGAALSFAKDVKKVVKAGVSLDRMKQQKKMAKQEIMKNQGSQNYVTRRHSKGNVFKVGKAGLHFDGSNFGQTTDAKTGKARSKRLDEVTMEQRSSGSESEADRTLRRNLEDYDVSKELTGANEKRLKEGMFNIFVNDALTFVAGVAALDPTGAGSAVSTGITTALAVAGLAKTAVTAGRQYGRNKGLKGFNANKSDFNKKVRRHNLAVITFERIKELNEYNLEAINPATTDSEEAARARTGLDAYASVGQRIIAMGTGYGPLARADSAQDMVNLMRNGFYREA